MQETGQKNSIPLSDEALALRFQNGDDAAFSELAARYLKVIRIKACSFREIFSLEREDLYQEGLLDMIVNGYAFSKSNDSVRVLNLNNPASACVLSADGKILETTMDDIELDIVQDYYSRNRKHLEES